MLCLACRCLSPVLLCRSCRGLLQPASDRVVDGKWLVRPALRHQGPARLLVHRLKYEGLTAAADVLAELMAPTIDNRAVLIPLPRVRWRHLRYGVDPARQLAKRLSIVTGRPWAEVLAPAWFSPAHAGRSKKDRSPPVFIQRTLVPTGAVLIDDVLTTGSTLRSAIDALDRAPMGAVTATVRGD
jgi:predicted amidophosphoribosyltransferase